MTRRFIAAIVLFIAYTGALAPAAEAQDAPPAVGERPTSESRPAQRRLGRNCRGDLAKLCPDVAAGDGARVQCLAGHRADLSKACRTAVHRAVRVAEVRNACQVDVQQSCAEIKPGAGRVRACLLAKADNLSPACRERIASGKGNLATAEAASLADEAVREEQLHLEPLPADIAWPETPLPDGTAEGANHAQ